MKPPEAGGFIDKGVTRSVYEHRTNPKLVVKVAKGELGIAAQRDECLTWQMAKGTEFEQFFAPVVWWSEDFSVAHQVRGRTPGMNHRTKRQIQPWMLKSKNKDLKMHNWRWIGHRLVLVDYASHRKIIEEMLANAGR